MIYTPVEGNSNLVRNSVTNAIVNINSSEYNSYVEERELKSKKSQKIEELENQIENIKDDISEIKNLLRSINNGKS